MKVDKNAVPHTSDVWSGSLPIQNQHGYNLRLTYNVTITQNDLNSKSSISVKTSMTTTDRQLWEISFTASTTNSSPAFDYLERIRDIACLPVQRSQSVEVAMQILCGRSPDPEDARY